MLSWFLSLRHLLRMPPPSGHRFDPISALLNAVALGTFIPGLDGIGRGQSGVTTVLELAIGISVGTVFVMRQLTLRAPMLPVDLFRRPVFALSVATAKFGGARRRDDHTRQRCRSIFNMSKVCRRSRSVC